jgi:hypothetical protein
MAPRQNPARKAAAPAASPPQRHEPEPEQRDPGGNGDETAEVVSRRADLRRVVNGLDAGHDPYDAEHERDRRASAAAQTLIHGRRQPEHGQRHQAADHVIAGRRARLRLQEGVVGHVQRDHADRRQEDPVLEPPGAGGAPSRRLRSRRPGGFDPSRRGGQRDLDLGGSRADPRLFGGLWLVGRRLGECRRRPHLRLRGDAG